MDYLDAVGTALLGNIPLLLVWLVGIVLAVIMLRRGGGRAEKLLLAGCSLMFVVQLVGLFLTGLVPWLVAERGMTRASAAGLTFSLPISILSMAGIVCLILAFWFRWRTKSSTE